MTTAHLQVLELPAARVLALSGEVDVLSAPALAAELPALLDGTGAVVLDLSDVTFFDSSGVRLVDQVARACAARPLRWRIVSPPGSTNRRLLDLVGMVGAQVCDDREAALADVAG